jgi:hypothetical protein
VVTLAQQFIEAGLIQFGWFRRENETVPFDLHLEMLGSYPDILVQAAHEAHGLVGEMDVTRLLSSQDSLPFALAYSLHCRIPLVYSQGIFENPAFDLVGAYDIGHSTLLLCNTIGWGVSMSTLLQGARRVGLEVHTVLTILEVSTITSTEVLTVLPLLRLTDIVQTLNSSGRLSDGHAKAVQEWIEGHTQA